MECTFSKRNLIVSICLTIAALVACYFIGKPEKADGVDEGNLAMYLGIIGFFIGLVGEGLNFFMQNPKNTFWLGIIGGIASGVIAAAIC